MFHTFYGHLFWLFETTFSMFWHITILFLFNTFYGYLFGLFETLLWPLDLSVFLLMELSGSFWIILRTILKSFGTFFGPYWELFRNILGPLWDPFWVFIKGFYPIKTILGCVLLGPFIDLFEIFYGHLFWLFETAFLKLECINMPTSYSATQSSSWKSRSLCELVSSLYELKIHKGP